MTDLDLAGEPPPPYIIFVVVFLFFVTGLLGFLICHLLKKKGYRCRTGDIEDEEDEKQAENIDEDDEDNQDTVEQILKCIIENEANMEAFKEMLGNQKVCVKHDPRLLRKESVGAIPPHHHTVHSGSDLNSCHLCTQGRSKKNRRRSRTPRAKQRPGEQTVFSVGRFRVIHTDKKLHGDPNPLNDSGDNLDQSQDSQDRKEGETDQKEGGYNLRNMFKDVRSPSESANGFVPSTGKRKKSLTIFGLRRGSDPIGIKISTLQGGRRFQQDVVIEDPLESSCQPDDTGVGESTPKAANGSVPHSVSLPLEAKAPSTQAPSTLRIPCTVPSSQTVKMGEDEGACSPGPLQTSTPIAPGPAGLSGLPATLPSPQSEATSSRGLSIIQFPTGPSSGSSPDLDAGIGGSLASVSLGSSPGSFYPAKTPSPALFLKTPTSPPVLTLSPRQAQASSTTRTRAASTPSLALTPSPKISSILKKPGQSPVPPLADTRVPVLSPSPKPGSSPRVSLKAGGLTLVSSTDHSEDDVVPATISLMDSEVPGGARVLKSFIKKTERPGILKKDKLLPGTGEVKGSVPSSPSDVTSRDRMSILHVSPSSSLSPTSPLGRQVSSVTIVKASPDSKRVFSVATMVEENDASISAAGKTGDNGTAQKSDPSAESENVGEVGSTQVSPAGEVGSTESQEKDDMVEMEDIRDCKVSQNEKEETLRTSSTLQEQD